MVNEQLYQEYLRMNMDIPEPVNLFCRCSHIFLLIAAMKQASTCGPDLHAVNQAYTKNSNGYAVTGVAAVSCRHAFVCPQSVIDLQKGER